MQHFEKNITQDIDSRSLKILIILNKIAVSTCIVKCLLIVLSIRLLKN